MSKQWVRCNRGIRVLTDELSQMRRELRTLQWSLSLNNGTTTSTNGTSVETISVQSTGISRDVSQKRGHHRLCSCPKRRFVSASTISRISTQHDCDSHSAAGDVGVVFSQNLSVVALFQRFFRVSHLFGAGAKSTHRAGPIVQQFPELQQLVQAWWAKLQRRQG